jgi:hypothetical protein
MVLQVLGEAGSRVLGCPRLARDVRHERGTRIQAREIGEISGLERADQQPSGLERSHASPVQYSPNSSRELGRRRASGCDTHVVLMKCFQVTFSLVVVPPQVPHASVIVKGIPFSKLPVFRLDAAFLHGLLVAVECAAEVSP